jgi:glycine dehydrogenase subunit 1
LVCSAPFFKEFTIELPCDSAELCEKLVGQGYIAGLPLGRYFPERSRQLTIAVTEKRSREEIDGLASAIARAISA